MIPLTQKNPLSNNHRIRRLSGFTLLEVLIAISLSAILMVVLSAGFSQITKRWEQQDGLLDQRLDESMILMELEKAILGAFPYTYQSKGFKRFIFFDGDSSSVRLISTMSPAYDNQVMIWWLEAKPGGGLKLQVTPALTGDPNEVLEKLKSEATEVLDGFKIRFEYLKLTKKKQKVWKKQWSGKEKQSLPIAMRISLEEISEDDNKRHLELISMIPAYQHQTINPID